MNYIQKWYFSNEKEFFEIFLEQIVFFKIDNDFL